MDAVSAAPIYQIPPREVVAVEHPMIIKNIEKGLKTFGNGKPFGRILHVADPEGCLPLYLRHNDPMCAPILSHNTNTNNVLLKITVPKRIGKRKRGSRDSYSTTGPKLPLSAIDGSSGSDGLYSHSRKDGAALLLRSLRDNADDYQAQAVAEIERTHRFRGLTDFHHSTARSEFSNKFQEFVLPGEAEKTRQFKFDLSRGWKKNEEFLPPPSLTNQTLPFNWGWHQNPNIETNVNENTREAELVNAQKSGRTPMQIIAPDVKSIPQSSPFAFPDDPHVREVIAKLTEALKERPIWTRRALGNRLGSEALPAPISKALHHVVYQFKGGPFRDALIKYGIDPRTDKKYRKYQTLYFRLFEEEKGHLKPWKDVHAGVSLSRNVVRTETSSHIFNGQTIIRDGMIWQLCDITDPLLVRLIDDAALRNKYEATSDGYFSNGSWAKIRAIMRTKLVAIRTEVTLSDLDFQAALQIPDVVEEDLKESHRISVPVPTIRLTKVDVQETIEGEDDTNSGWQTSFTRRKKKRLEASQRTGLVQKRKYARKKPLPGNGGAKTEPKRPEESPDRGRATPNVLPSIERRSIGNDGNHLDQPNTPSEAYLTAEENVDDLQQDLERDEDEDDEEGSDEDGLEEEDINDGESSDEEAEDDDQDSGHDDDPNERRSPGTGDEKYDYDSETTDVVDPTTHFIAQSRPQSCS